MRATPDSRRFSGFRIFLLCLTLGIFTIAGVGSLSSALVGGMVAQGRAILGGDIDLRLVHRAAFDTERGFIGTLGAVSEVATMRAMVRVADDTSFEETMLVEAKSVDGLYPLYGAVSLSAMRPLPMRWLRATRCRQGLWRCGRTRS